MSSPQTLDFLSLFMLEHSPACLRVYIELQYTKVLTSSQGPDKFKCLGQESKSIVKV